jgi:transcriptional regulator with XRE-family HTH domain
VTPTELKRELRRIAWGQERLAEKLGVWPREVRNWLSGKARMSAVVAADIRRLPSHNRRPPTPT